MFSVLLAHIWEICKWWKSHYNFSVWEEDMLFWYASYIFERQDRWKLWMQINLWCCAYLSAKLFQSIPTLCDSMDSNPPGSSVHGILQAQILEWVAISSCRRSFQPRDRIYISYVSCIGSRNLDHQCHSCLKEYL